MKIVSRFAISAVVLIATLALTSCKKEKTGPQGPAGPAGPQGSPGIAYTTNGFIKGTVTGTRMDGTPINESFNYTGYFGNSPGTVDSLNYGYGFQFFMARSTNDIFSSDYINLTINTMSKAASTGTLSSMYFSFEKPLGNNKVFIFTTNSVTTASVSGLSYNAATGLFSGNFTCYFDGSSNSSGNPATITGSFQCNLMETVHITRLVTDRKQD